MGECIIKRQGGAVDISDLTATPADVVAGEKFYGSGTDEIQTGTQKKIGKISKVLAANETYVIPAGYVDAGSAVTQNIVTQGAMTVNPVANGSLLNVSGKYMTGDITVNGVENLKPENIRAGASIGTVPGEWQGYVNNDELCPYWFGIFGPGQVGVVRDYSYAYHGNGSDKFITWADNDEAYTKDPSHNISFRLISYRSSSGGYAFFGVFFTTPIEMQGAKKVTILYRTSNWYYSDRNRIFLMENLDSPYDENWNVNTAEIGYSESFVLPVSEGSYTEQTFNLTDPSKLKYVCVGIGIPPASGTGRGISVISIKISK